MESHPSTGVPAAICRAASASPPVIGPPDLSFSSADRADHTAAPIASLITGMRGRRRRHVSVDARTRSVGFSDEAAQSGVGAALTAKTGGGCARGCFGPRAATVPFRSSRLFGDPQRPGGGGGGRAESIDRCAAAPQPSRTHPLWLRRRPARTGSLLPQLGGAVLSPAGS